MYRYSKNQISSVFWKETELGKDNNMKKSGTTPVVLMVAVGFVLMSIAGCQEQDPSNTRMSKLIALENKQLKKQLEQCDEEIENQKQLLEECQEVKKVLEKQAKENFENIVAPLLQNFAEKTRKLQEENTKLKAQTEELKTETEELKAQTEELKAQIEELKAQIEELEAQIEEPEAQIEELEESPQQEPSEEPETL